ncbi:MAG: hypothetical protein LKH79_23210 [Heyndrickxia oleronia]|jgi:hypothetical protein|uniref:hypothetical protein n=1 Tax=Heyndrickxia oleronia TaxID=38875 RepID=UPI00242C2253|nr:hypothetical protein [Heyndrickxia oleronia]MCI1593387.1 hypothetical protein [Heyndrickxia oleronia]
MWKGLFNAISKANKESKQYAEKMREEMLAEKNRKAVEYYIQEIYDDYKNDTEQQRLVREVDEQLQYLVLTNQFCNHCIKLLKNPMENKGLLDTITSEIKKLHSKTAQFVESTEFKSNEYKQRILRLVTPYLEVSEIIFGNTEEEEPSGGVMGFYVDVLNSGDNNWALWEELQYETIDFIENEKLRIKDAFLENKKFQVVTFGAYDTVGKVDFGTYSITDLE